MNYLHAKDFDYRRNDSNWKKPFFLALLALFLYLWGSGIFAKSAAFLTYPLLKISSNVSGSFFDALNTQTSLLEENKKLAAENERLTVLSRRLDELVDENTELRGFRAGGQLPDSTILTKVIIKPGQLPYDEIIIDVGSDDDARLKSGNLVFADNDVVLGQIESVGSNFSRVKLYSEGGVSLPVAIGPNGHPSVALGLGAGNFSLSLPRGLDIKVGDAVRTTIVGDYILGFAATVDKAPNDPFQKIQFRSPYNVYNLDWVFVRH